MLAVNTPTHVWASDALVSAYSNTLGAFTIMGNNLNRVTEAEIGMSYQSDSSSTPQVNSLLSGTSKLSAQGSGGSLTISIKCASTPCKRPLSGNVPFAIAYIQGTISSLSALLRYENGSTEYARVSVTNPTQDQLDAKKAAEAAAEEARRDAIAREQNRLGQERKESEEQEAAAKSTERSSEPSCDGEQSTVNKLVQKGASDSVDANSGLVLNFSRRESILDRFRSHKGNASKIVLEKLFDRQDAMFTQDPPVLLSDGTTPLRLVVRAPVSGNATPQFFISGASCRSLTVAGVNGGWLLEIMPKKGSMNSTVTVLYGKNRADFPLAVAPPLALFDSRGVRKEDVEYVVTANRLALKRK